MSFSNPATALKAQKRAGAAIRRKAQKRLSELGKPHPVCFKVPRAHLDIIQQAAAMEQRTATNYIYHHAFAAAMRAVKAVTP